MKVVWYKLDDAESDKVTLSKDAIVVDLKEAVKTKWGNTLARVDAPQLQVFAKGAAIDTDEPLDPGDSVPARTTSKRPLIVVAPEARKKRRVTDVVYRVNAIVKQAKHSYRVRGTVYKQLQRNGGMFSVTEGIGIRYKEGIGIRHDNDNSDLLVSAYFESSQQAIEFQHVLQGLGGVEINPGTPEMIYRPHDLDRIMLRHYSAHGSESPCQSLNELHEISDMIPNYRGSGA
jgi:hypothetical protein